MKVMYVIKIWMKMNISVWWQIVISSVRFTEMVMNMQLSVSRCSILLIVWKRNLWYDEYEHTFVKAAWRNDKKREWFYCIWKGNSGTWSRVCIISGVYETGDWRLSQIAGDFPALQSPGGDVRKGRWRRKPGHHDSDSKWQNFELFAAGIAEDFRESADACDFYLSDESTCKWSVSGIGSCTGVFWWGAYIGRGLWWRYDACRTQPGQEECEYYPDESWDAECSFLA